MQTLTIKELIKNNLAVSTEDGDIVYNKLKNFLQNGEKVILDFNEVFVITTAFLNVAIGKLYGNIEFNSEFLNQNIKITNVEKDDIMLFKKVTDRAKEYYSQKENIDQSANDALDD
jgi:hypothetical protein